MTDALKYKKQLERERDLCLQQAYNLKAKAEKIALEIIEVDRVIDTRELTVSDHAIDRFKERVMDLPIKKIRQLLTSSDLLKAYRNKGEGRYGLKELPHVILHIRDFSVVTVINTNEPEKRLEMLGHYMDYFIDEIALKHQGHEVNIMKIKTYKNLYWRNQTKSCVA